MIFAQASPALAHARVLHLKLGLTAFLLLPLEAFHAYVCAAWIGPGLRGGGRARDLERGLGLDDMVRSLQVPLFGIGGAAARLAVDAAARAVYMKIRLRLVRDSVPASRAASTQPRV